MQLTLHTDYALRVLLYLAIAPAGATNAEISESYGISGNHVAKIVKSLREKGYIATERGRGGGMTLAVKPAEINVGKVVREMENTLDLLECFDPPTNTCPIAPVCGIKGAVFEARTAFLAVLDRYYLSDALSETESLRGLLGVGGPH